MNAERHVFKFRTTKAHDFAVASLSESLDDLSTADGSGDEMSSSDPFASPALTVQQLTFRAVQQLSQRMDEMQGEGSKMVSTGLPDEGAAPGALGKAGSSKKYGVRILATAETSSNHEHPGNHGGTKGTSTRYAAITTRGDDVATSTPSTLTTTVGGKGHGQVLSEGRHGQHDTAVRL